MSVNLGTGQRPNFQGIHGPDPKPGDPVRTATRKREVTAIWRDAEIPRPREFDGRRHLEANRAGRRRALADPPKRERRQGRQQQHGDGPADPRSVR